MKQFYLLITVGLLACTNANAQDTLHGGTQVLFGPPNNELLKPLVGVTLTWLGTTSSVTSNPIGEFALPTTPLSKQLVVRKQGFITDTITISNTKQQVQITLTKSPSGIAGISISTGAKPTSISYLSAGQVLKIREGELLKAACCNLSESFETTPSVDVSFTDAITGQKQIQMLGLATPNTLITQENIPNIRGLASTIGLNYTPGTWVQGMQLSKGSGSVANGYEGLAGQINVELKKPDDDREQYYLNVYQNTGGRFEANANIFAKINKNISGGVLLHHKNQFASTDNNHDGFMDNPTGQQNIAAFRAQYFDAKGIEVQTIIRAINTTDRGGQVLTTHHQLLPLWGYNAEVQRNEATLKLGKLYKQKPWKSMGLQLAAFTHKQKMRAGTRQYQAGHKNFYANYIFQTIIGNTNHGIKLGASALYDSIHEQLPTAALQYLRREEFAIGVFAEHSYNFLDKLTIVSGLRVDRHNLFGAFFTPRIHARYTPRYGTVLRASLGRARRTVSIINENHALYFSNRNVNFSGDSTIWQQGLQPEKAWNMGASITQDFVLNYRKGTAVLDYYYTHFNQLWVADFESPREVYMYNNINKAYAHAVQATVDYEIIRKKLDIRIAYKYYDVANNYRGQTLQKALQPRHRGFVNLSFRAKTKTTLDATVHYTGVKRLPNAFAQMADAQFIDRQYSNAFLTYNAHASQQLAKNFEVYIGGENLSNFMQHNAIIMYNTPLAADFDAAQVWGPVMGINAYLGLRLKGAWRK